MFQDFDRQLHFILFVGGGADQVTAVALVFGADVFDRFRVGIEFELDGDDEALGKGFGSSRVRRGPDFRGASWLFPRPRAGL
jgi:hypothetical protein